MHLIHDHQAPLSLVLTAPFIWLTSVTIGYYRQTQAGSYILGNHFDWFQLRLPLPALEHIYQAAAMSDCLVTARLESRQWSR